MTRLSAYAYIVAKPDKIQHVHEACRSIVERVEKEDGCLAYHLLVDSADERVVAWFERWRDEESFAAHLEGGAARRLSAALHECLLEPMVIRKHRNLSNPRRADCAQHRCQPLWLHLRLLGIVRAISPGLDVQKCSGDPNGASLDHTGTTPCS